MVRNIGQATPAFIYNRAMDIAILITCFNRKVLTLRLLDGLHFKLRDQVHTFTIFLLDDGSLDGTADAVKREFPNVRLLRGNGSLFWNGGMRRVFAEAMSIGFDAYLFLNDDVQPYEGALSKMIACALESESTVGPAIIVGSMQNEHSLAHSYGGFVRQASGPRLEWVPVLPSPSSMIRCHTMNANLILVPATVAVALGNLEETFQHQFGDLDYGLRATAAGIPIFLAPGYLGVCCDNPNHKVWLDRSQRLSVRWKHLVSPKGIPPGEWLFYVRRHYGWRWPIYAISPYLRALWGRPTTTPSGSECDTLRKAR